MKITKDMTIFDTIRAHPGTLDVLKSYEMSCCGCLAVMDESLEQGARRHGADVEKLIKDLNALFHENTREEDK